MVFRWYGVLRGLRVLAFVLPVTVSPMPGQVESESPANLQVFQRLAFEIGSDLDSRLATGVPSIGGVTVLPREIGLSVEKELARGLGVSGDSSGRDSAGLVLEFIVTEARVYLEDIRRDGFLGPRIADRVVVLGGRAKAWRAGSPPLYLDATRSLRDTVRLSGVESLENPPLSFTQIVIPREGFFDSLLEPVIVLGAVGVAVYLLFAVRS